MSRDAKTRDINAGISVIYCDSPGLFSPHGQTDPIHCPITWMSQLLRVNVNISKGRALMPLFEGLA